MAEPSELKIFSPFSEPAVSLRGRRILIVSSSQDKNAETQNWSLLREKSEHLSLNLLLSSLGRGQRFLTVFHFLLCQRVTINVLTSLSESFHWKDIEINLGTGLGKALQLMYKKTSLMGLVEKSNSKYL